MRVLFNAQSQEILLISDSATNPPSIYRCFALERGLVYIKHFYDLSRDIFMIAYDRFICYFNLQDPSLDFILNYSQQSIIKNIFKLKLGLMDFLLVSETLLLYLQIGGMFVGTTIALPWANCEDCMEILDSKYDHKDHNIIYVIYCETRGNQIILSKLCLYEHKWSIMKEFTLVHSLDIGSRYLFSWIHSTSNIWFISHSNSLLSFSIDECSTINNELCDCVFSVFINFASGLFENQEEFIVLTLDKQIKYYVNHLLVLTFDASSYIQDPLNSDIPTLSHNLDMLYLSQSNDLNCFSIKACVPLDIRNAIKVLFHILNNDGLDLFFNFYQRFVSAIVCIPQNPTNFHIFFQLATECCIHKELLVRNALVLLASELGFMGEVDFFLEDYLHEYSSIHLQEPKRKPFSIKLHTAHLVQSISLKSNSSKTAKEFLSNYLKLTFDVVLMYFPNVVKVLDLEFQQFLKQTSEPSTNSTSDDFRLLKEEAWIQDSVMNFMLNNGLAVDLISKPTLEPSIESLPLDFQKDLRMKEVEFLLSYSTPSLHSMQQEEQPQDSIQMVLFNSAWRKFSYCLGRTAFLFHSSSMAYYKPNYLPDLLQCFPVNLSGKFPPYFMTTKLALNNITDKAFHEALSWSHFQNAFSILIAYSRSAILNNVSRHWICQQLKYSPESFGGIVLCLSFILDRPLIQYLDFVDVYAFLSEKNEVNSCGLLLGLAISNRGTMEPRTSQILAAHLPLVFSMKIIQKSWNSMEYGSYIGYSTNSSDYYDNNDDEHCNGINEFSTAIDPIPNSLQISSMLGLGWLYFKTSDMELVTLIIDYMSNYKACVRDENSFLVSCGISLGMCCFTLGTSLNSFRFEDKLLKMLRSPVLRIPSVVALALAFFGTCSKAIDVIISSTFNLSNYPPDDIFMLFIAKNFINWNLIPDPSDFNLFIQESVDSLCMSSNHIISKIRIKSACLLLFALKYRNASDCTSYYETYFESFLLELIEMEKEETSAEDSYPDILACLDIIMISSAVLLCGTGHLPLLITLRKLHFAKDPYKSNNFPADDNVNDEVLLFSFATETALHFSIGLLCLGGGSKGGGFIKGSFTGHDDNNSTLWIFLSVLPMLANISYSSTDVSPTECSPLAYVLKYSWILSVSKEYSR